VVVLTGFSPVKIQKLEKANGFLAIDLPDAPLAVGPTRLAPKILQDGAELLARSITYSFAAFGLQLSGGSAGINAKPDERDAAISAYMEEVAPLVTENRWRTWPATGVTADDLAALRVADGDGKELDDPVLTAAGAVAAAGELGDVAIVGSGPVVDHARVLLAARGATSVAGGADAAATTLFLAGKSGMVDHEMAETVQARTVVPLTPLPITTKAYAVLRRAGATYVPDFVALAAPLLAGLDAGDGDPLRRVSELADALRPEGPGMWLAACGVAEAYLQTWQESLPFGRPLA
jgi:glutamate dehydrogenase/leucine dehydrogenase